MTDFLSRIYLRATNLRTVLLLLLSLILLITEGNACNNIHCSNIFDYVCGLVEGNNEYRIVKYQNICHLNRARCKLRPNFDIHLVRDNLCNIKQARNIARRVNDFSIVGAHQTCNHTCPTYCADIYEPACAQIWKSNMKSAQYKPMINHCHIDLFSCAFGVNVTIYPIGKCYKNPLNISFMSQIAAMKSLKLLDDAPLEKISSFTHPENNRRSYKDIRGALLGDYVQDYSSNKEI